MGDYRQEANILALGTATRGWSDQLYGFDVAIQYKPQPWLLASAGYSFERYDIDFGGSSGVPTVQATSYAANRVTISASVGF
jgi:hypothetical protein